MFSKIQFDYLESTITFYIGESLVGKVPADWISSRSSATGFSVTRVLDAIDHGIMGRYEILGIKVEVANDKIVFANICVPSSDYSHLRGALRSYRTYLSPILPSQACTCNMAKTRDGTISIEHYREDGSFQKSPVIVSAEDVDDMIASAKAAASDWSYTGKDRGYAYAVRVGSLTALVERMEQAKELLTIKPAISGITVEINAHGKMMITDAGKLVFDMIMPLQTFTVVSRVLEGDGKSGVSYRLPCCGIVNVKWNKNGDLLIEPEKKGCHYSCTVPAKYLDAIREKLKVTSA